MFVITTVFQVFAASVDVLMIQRVPLALGIPDELLYMSGNAVVRPIVFMTAVFRALCSPLAWCRQACRRPPTPSSRATSI